jgi:hypothetical protein
MRRVAGASLFVRAHACPCHGRRHHDFPRYELARAAAMPRLIGEFGLSRAWGPPGWSVQLSLTTVSRIAQQSPLTLSRRAAVAGGPMCGCASGGGGNTWRWHYRPRGGHNFAEPGFELFVHGDFVQEGTADKPHFVSIPEVRVEAVKGHIACTPSVLLRWFVNNQGIPAMPGVRRPFLPCLPEKLLKHLLPLFDSRLGGTHDAVIKHLLQQGNVFELNYRLYHRLVRQEILEHRPRRMVPFLKYWYDRYAKMWNRRLKLLWDRRATYVSHYKP